jgi:hypothetical protein
MKKIRILLIVLIIFPFISLGKPTENQVKVIQEMINEGNNLRNKYDEAKAKNQEATKKVMDDFANDDLYGKFIESLKRKNEAADKLNENRNKVIKAVIDSFGLTIPPGQSVGYDIDCKGECVHGYCSIECPIRLCEKAFNPQPWGGGGTPGWIATIIKHELEHKKQINPGPPPTWNNDLANGEYDAWQAALKCAQETGITLTERLKIIEIKLYWLKQMLAALEEKLKALSTLLDKIKSGAPGSTVHEAFVVKNISDEPQMIQCRLRDSLGWEMFPNTFSVILAPDQDTVFETMVFVPMAVAYGTKNEVFIDTETADGTALDFGFIFIEPPFHVLAGSTASGLRGTTVEVSFKLQAENDAPMDTLIVAMTNPLNWLVEPSQFEIILSPGQSENLIASVELPVNLPYWTSNLIYCNAFSKFAPVRMSQDKVSITVLEHDITPLLIESPLGKKNYGTTEIPKARVYNSGHIDSFFDVFCEIDVKPKYLDSLKNLSLSPNEEKLFQFKPFNLLDTGWINIKIFTKTIEDANQTNDTIISTFYIQPISAPEINSIEPDSGIQGNTVSILIKGNNFIDGADIQLTPSQGLTVSNIQYINEHELSSTIYIPISAQVTTYSLIVINPDRQSDTLKNAFKVIRKNFPEKVILLSPLNNAVIYSETVEFVWQQTGNDTESYYFELSENENFTNSSIDSTMTDTLTVVSNLKNGQSYWWRAKAKNLAGWGHLSDIWSFTVSITDVKQLSSNIRLINIDPNPASDEAYLTFTLDRPSEIYLTIQNLWGQRIKTLRESDMTEEGIQSFRLDLRVMESGIYICNLHVNHEIKVIKIIVLK